MHALKMRASCRVIYLIQAASPVRVVILKQLHLIPLRSAGQNHVWFFQAWTLETGLQSRVY